MPELIDHFNVEGLALSATRVQQVLGSWITGDELPRARCSAPTTKESHLPHMGSNFLQIYKTGSNDFSFVGTGSLYRRSLKKCGMACVVQRLRKASTDMSRIQFISQAAKAMPAQAKLSRQSVPALLK